MSDSLPPGNFHLPSSEDQAHDIALILQEETWPDLWPRIIHRYATTAARNADLAGLGSADRAFAYVDALGYVTIWNGTAWLADTPWVAITNLAVGAYADIGSPPQWRVKLDGAVELRGIIRATTTFASGGVMVTTLVAAARPSSSRHFSAARNFASANTSDARVSIDSSGELFFYCPNDETIWFSLDGVFYYRT